MSWGKFFNHDYWGSVTEEEVPEEPAKKAGLARLELAVGIAKGEGRPTTPYIHERIVPKGKWVKFTVPPARRPDGANYRWTVRNTGDEARAANALFYVHDGGPEFWRSTAYRGVHSATCEIIKDAKVIAVGSRRVRVGTW